MIVRVKKSTEKRVITKVYIKCDHCNKEILLEFIDKDLAALEIELMKRQERCYICEEKYRLDIRKLGG